MSSKAPLCGVEMFEWVQGTLDSNLLLPYMSLAIYGCVLQCQGVCSRHRLPWVVPSVAFCIILNFPGEAFVGSGVT